MSSEELILKELMSINKTLGDHSAQLEDIQKTVNNGLSSNVKDLKQSFDEFLLKREDSCPIAKIEKEREKSKTGKYRRKQDVRLVKISLVIAIIGILVSVCIAVFTTIWRKEDEKNHQQKINSVLDYKCPADFDVCNDCSVC